MEDQFIKWIPIIILLLTNILSVSSVFWVTQIRIVMLRSRVETLEKQQINYATLHDNVVEIKAKLNYFLPQNINENEKSNKSF